MSENKSGSPENARGGCLDAIVGFLSRGYLGVETTTENIESSEIFSGNSLETGDSFHLAMREGRTVIIKDNKPKLIRRIVRNKKAVQK